VEDWLYDEGSDKMKNVYSQKIDEIKKYGEPIKERKREFEDSKVAIRELEIAIQLANKHLDLALSKESAKYDHWVKEDVDKFAGAVKDGGEYLDMVRQACMTAPKHLPLPIKSADIFKAKKTLDSTISPIINKPKPKVETPPKDTTTPEETAAKGADNGPVNNDATVNNHETEPHPMEVE